MIFLLSVAPLIGLVNSVAFKGPAATPRATNAGLDGWTPRPTPKPELRHLLGKRAASTTEQVGFFVDDNTCGYLDGSIGAGKYCDSPSTCFVVTGSGGGLVGCGLDHTLDLETDCVDSHQYFYGTACGDTCRHDSLILKCTDLTAPYCNGYVFTEWGASFYSCDSEPATEMGIIETTYLGETDGRTWTPMFLGPATSTSRYTSPGNTFPTTPTTPGPSPSPFPKPIKKTSVGPVVGGVVGGIAVVGIIACVAIFLCLRRRRQNLSPEIQVRPQAQLPPPQPAVPAFSPMGQYVPPAPYAPPTQYPPPMQYAPASDVKYEYVVPSPAVSPPPINPTPAPPPPPNVAQLDAISPPRNPHGGGPVYEKST